MGHNAWTSAFSDPKLLPWLLNHLDNESVYTVFFISLISIILTQCQSSPKTDYTTDILITGGGACGIAAAIQAARMEKKVIVVEPTEWLGGMLTAAGVSAIDGNHNIPTGLWGEFRQHLYDHYGGPSNMATGWVSNTLFEPDVAEAIIKEMVEAEPNIEIIHGFYIDRVHKNRSQITHIEYTDLKQKRISIAAQIVIDATEYGELLARAGEAYSIGLEPKSETGELNAPDSVIRWSQDLTYVATLQDYGNQAELVERPDYYYPEMFRCLCKQVCDDPKDLLDCSQVLTYGKLPNQKYMINWPSKGNDYHIEILEMEHEERGIALNAAKGKTLQFIYFLQTEAGFSHLGLSTETYPTADHFALIPYIRESRRVYGHTRLVLPDIRSPYKNSNRPLYKAAVATGDHPIDHHQRLNPIPMEIDFPKIPSYSVPYNILIPKRTDNLIIAEKVFRLAV